MSSIVSSQRSYDAYFIFLSAAKPKWHGLQNTNEIAALQLYRLDPPLTFFTPPPAFSKDIFWRQLAIFFGDNRRHTEAYIMLLTGTAKVNVLAWGALRRFTQWPWIEHPTFKLRNGHSELSVPIVQVLSATVTRGCFDFGCFCWRFPRGP